MGVRLITPPTDAPMTLAEIKEVLRVDTEDDDDLLLSHMATASAWVERLLNRKLMTQTWEFVIDHFPTGDAEVQLPFGPVQSITSIKYDDVDGAEQTIDPADYYLDDVSPDVWVFTVDGWPTVLDAVNSVRIRFVAGYETADDIPGQIREAFRYRVQELYDGGDYSREIMNMLTFDVPMVA